jgi:hypothetical protein
MDELVAIIDISAGLGGFVLRGWEDVTCTISLHHISYID